MYYRLNKLLFIAISIIFITLLGSSGYSVVLFLCAIISTCLSNVFGSEHKAKAFTVLVILNILFSLILPEYALFLPLLLFDVIYYKKFALSATFFLPIINFSIHTLYVAQPIRFSLLSNTKNTYIIFALLLLFLYLISALFGFQSLHIWNQEHQIIQLKDTFTEHQLRLINEKESILQQQNYEIHIATLNERNRIAREIHDNVGHMISRSLLQIGALIAVNKDDTKQLFYESLKDSLNEAMTNIRNSVHDLHDESINLKENLEKLLHNFTFCETKLDFDMSEHSDISIKYCFIAITKEALNNTMKHSKANLVRIHIIEHPAFYQYIYEDTTQYTPSANQTQETNNNSFKNKQDTEKQTEINTKTTHEIINNTKNDLNLNNQSIINNNGTHHTGIGISNMRERIEKFNGNFVANTTPTGYCIHISIPKKS